MKLKNKTNSQSISNVPTEDLSLVQSSEVKDKPNWKHATACSVLRIRFNDVGQSYRQIFKPFLMSSVNKIILYDPYFIKEHQLTNLKIFLQYVTTDCHTIKKIQIVTKHCNEEELNKLLPIYRKENLSWKKDKMLHDRQICFIKPATMTTIFMGRGLDIYQRCEYKRLEQNLNQDKMKCMPTTLIAIESRLQKSNKVASKIGARKTNTKQLAQAA